MDQLYIHIYIYIYAHIYISVYKSIYTTYILFPLASCFDTVKYRMQKYRRVTVKLATVTFLLIHSNTKITIKI